MKDILSLHIDMFNLLPLKTQIYFSVFTSRTDVA